MCASLENLLIQFNLCKGQGSFKQCNTWAYLSLTGMQNLAYGKIASQSSFYQVGVADRAVDGNRDDSFLNCTHISSELGAWWVVNLESNYLVQEVLITFSGGNKLSRHNNG